MARLFPDAGDNIQLASQTPTDASTVAMWVRDPAGDGHSLPRLMQWGGRHDLFVQTSDGKIRYQRNFSTTNGVWIVTDPVTWSGWRHVAVTYDGDPDNDPIIYLDGSPLALTESTAPVGTPNNTSGTIAVGNNTTPNRNWGGSVNWFAIYNRVLSESEVEDVMEFGYITDAALTHGLYLSGADDLTDLATAATWTDSGTGTDTDQAPITTVSDEDPTFVLSAASRGTVTLPASGAGEHTLTAAGRGTITMEVTP